MPKIVEVPGLGDVEFPDGTPKTTMEGAIKNALLKRQGQPQADIPVGLSMGTGFEAPAYQPGPEIPAFVARAAPGLVPAPGIAAPLSAGGEALAQFLEGGQMRPEQIALAAAIPPGAAAVGRLGRGLVRTGTRLVPSFFEKAQRGALEAGETLVESLRPAEDLAALAKSARAGGTDLIPASNVQRLIGEIKLPAVPANPKLGAVKTTIDNLKAVLQPGGKIGLDDLEAIRRDIGPLLQSKGAPAELRGVYGAIVTDLEKEAASGGVGASLARQAATAFKQDLGAAKVAELIDKATTRRTFGGADVPALDISKFAKSLQDPKTKKQILDQIGPGAFRTVEEFVTRFKGLPPTMAYAGWNSLITVLSGSAGGLAGGIPGAVGAAIAPELLRNMAAVGANPKALNAVMISVSQGIRAASAGRTPLGGRAGMQP